MGLLLREPEIVSQMVKAMNGLLVNVNGFRSVSATNRGENRLLKGCPRREGHTMGTDREKKVQ